MPRQPKYEKTEIRNAAFMYSRWGLGIKNGSLAFIFSSVINL